jgi:hypothetical protein
LSATNTCTGCTAGMGKAADAAVVTAPVTATAACTVTCTGGCQTCGATAGVCVSCKAGYFKSAADTCAWCPSGKGKDADPVTANSAVSTTSGATECGVTCTAASNCLACGATADAAKCLACAAGRYLETATGTTKDTCVACTTGCKTCTATGLTACPSCADNFYYSAANTCMACPTGKTRTAPTAAPTAVEADTVCTAATTTTTTTTTTAGSSATLIQALCGASVAAYALF